MISDDQLDTYRIENIVLRVVRDVNPANDVKGIVVAWDDESVLIRKQNRRVVKLGRGYVYQPFTDPRPPEYMLPQESAVLEDEE
ncbi:hypothetical protein [Paenibacillus hexagrammi]|uniref:Uncharacterized protein n=1 Tax=Paenibacillus hexagrammi TaxID=2908839 RepID=A0ABY3SEM6_9BACL|nr:hypothetical protein [Paenibacillus sp. YPD9-1]UJF31525.1 hypothetical protein L0M14_17105 [Paenibacillus sp. YPD9-1]